MLHERDQSISTKKKGEQPESLRYYAQNNQTEHGKQLHPMGQHWYYYCTTTPPPKTPWTKGTRLVYTRRFPNLPWPPRNGSGFSAQSCGSPSCRWYVLPVGRQHQTLFLHTQTHNRIKRSPQSKKKYLWNRNHNLSKTRVGSACHL